jgi:hypothetical protein
VDDDCDGLVNEDERDTMDAGDGDDALDAVSSAMDIGNVTLGDHSTESAALTGLTIHEAGDVDYIAFDTYDSSRVRGSPSFRVTVAPADPALVLTATLSLDVSSDHTVPTWSALTTSDSRYHESSGASGEVYLDFVGHTEADEEHWLLEISASTWDASACTPYDGDASNNDYTVTIAETP